MQGKHRATRECNWFPAKCELTFCQLTALKLVKTCCLYFPKNGVFLMVMRKMTKVYTYSVGVFLQL